MWHYRENRVMKFFRIETIGALFSFGVMWCLTDAETEFLIKKHAPLLKLHKAEEGLPSSVRWYWNQCFLKKKNYNKAGQLIGSELVTIDGVAMNPGAITAEILGNLPNTGDDYFLEPVDESVYKGERAGSDGFLQAESYAHLVERNAGKDNKERIVIQYMFFYPYQGALPFIPNLPVAFMRKYIPIHKIGYHVGDWEHTDIYLDKIAATGDVAQDYKLSQVFYARHGQRRGDFLYANQIKELFNDQGKLDVNGTHPVVYIAKHSHGGYPGYFAGVSADADMVSKNGPLWPTWRHVKNVGSLENPISGCEWIKAKQLRWGNTVSEEIPFTSIEYHGNSPETPSSGGWFARPGLEEKPLETTVQGKRVDGPNRVGLQISLKPLKQDKTQQGHSKYFDLEIPARMRFLQFKFRHPDASSFKFDVYEYKYGFKNKKIYADAAHQAVFAIPSSYLLKNLYIDNFRIIDQEGRVTKNLIIDPMDIILDIYGFEE